MGASDELGYGDLIQSSKPASTAVPRRWSSLDSARPRSRPSSARSHPRPSSARAHPRPNTPLSHDAAWILEAREARMRSIDPFFKSRAKSLDAVLVRPPEQPESGPVAERQPIDMGFARQPTAPTQPAPRDGRPRRGRPNSARATTGRASSGGGYPTGQ